MTINREDLSVELEIISGTLSEWADNNFETANNCSGDQARGFNETGEMLSDWSEKLEAARTLLRQDGWNFNMDEAPQDGEWVLVALPKAKFEGYTYEPVVRTAFSFKRGFSRYCDQRDADGVEPYAWKPLDLPPQLPETG